MRPLFKVPSEVGCLVLVLLLAQPLFIAFQLGAQGLEALLGLRHPRSADRGERPGAQSGELPQLPSPNWGTGRDDMVLPLLFGPVGNKLRTAIEACEGHTSL